MLTDASGASWAPRRFDIGEPAPAKPAASGKQPAAKNGAAAEFSLSNEQVRAATLDSPARAHDDPRLTASAATWKRSSTRWA